MNLVFLSHTAMGGSFVVGSHHLAKAFAAAGHSVTHLSAPVSIPHVALAMRGGFTRTRVLRWLRGGEYFNEVHDVVPLSLIPWRFVRYLPALMNSSSTMAFTTPFRGFTMRRMRRADWLIVDDPRLIGMATRRTAARLMYRATDLYAEMGHDPSIIDAEKSLCRRADMLVATSDVVAEHLNRISGRDVLVIKNGVDFEMFSPPLVGHPLDLGLPGARETRAVYVGSFDRRFGLEALRNAATALRDKQFILIGPGSEAASRKLDSGNVTALGAVAYPDIPKILWQCAVGMLPLSNDAANAGRSPMKLYEYAAAGLSVAATATKELRGRDLPTLSLAEVEQDFGAAVHRAFIQAGDKTLLERGRLVAAREGWSSKAKEMLELLTAGAASDRAEWRGPRRRSVSASPSKH